MHYFIATRNGNEIKCNKQNTTPAYTDYHGPAKYLKLLKQVCSVCTTFKIFIFLCAKHNNRRTYIHRQNKLYNLCYCYQFNQKSKCFPGKGFSWFLDLYRPPSPRMANAPALTFTGALISPIAVGIRFEAGAPVKFLDKAASSVVNECVLSNGDALE